MMFYVDQRRTDKSFEVGDWVYLKLKPYRQFSTKAIKDHILSKQYFGPFQIMEKIGPVAYKLELPPSSRIHPVFHISLLKKHNGEILPSMTPSLPSTFNDHHSIFKPKEILGRRTVQNGPISTKQVLVQWEYSLPEEAMWEDLTDLEDKANFEEGGNVTLTITQPKLPDQLTSSSPRKSTRQLQTLHWFKDYQLNREVRASKFKTYSLNLERWWKSEREIGGAALEGKGKCQGAESLRFSGGKKLSEWC